MPENNTYDAIVIGSGISGGWAAKELTEKGLKVLMLERRRTDRACGKIMSMPIKIPGNFLMQVARTQK
jgi:choline dehydrogenase-like flavoprotein